MREATRIIIRVGTTPAVANAKGRERTPPPITDETIAMEADGIEDCRDKWVTEGVKCSTERDFFMVERGEAGKRDLKLCDLTCLTVTQPVADTTRGSVVVAKWCQGADWHKESEPKLMGWG